MVKVSFRQDDKTLHFMCVGHAEYAKDGEPDIVCAAVSALSVTLCNALAHCSGFCCNVEAGDVQMTCRKTGEAQTIFHAIMIGFRGLVFMYPDHVSIDTRERPLRGEPYVQI